MVFTLDAVSVKDLRKNYADFEAVKGISFDVEEGSFFAFLGPNGAGKSTTISIICSLLDYDSGSVTVFGKDVSDRGARTDIGVVFQDHMLDDILTVRENVQLRGEMYGLKGKELADAVENVLSITGAKEIEGRRYGKLSGGQKRRADIARALVHSPKILVLDEPTAGLDPQSRKALWNTVSELNKKYGMTIFLTTHYMEEAADADDIVIISSGEIVAHGTPDQLKEQYCTDYIRAVPKDESGLRSVLDNVNVDYKVEKGIYTINIASTLESVPILEKIAPYSESFEVRTGTLDDAFISITGGANDE